MNIAVMKLLSRRGPGPLRLVIQNAARMKSSDKPCPPGEDSSKTEEKTEEPCPKEPPCPKTPPKTEEPPCPKTPAKTEEPPCPKTEPPKTEDPCPKSDDSSKKDPPPPPPKDKEEPCPPGAKAKNPCPIPIKAKEPCPPKKPEPCPASSKFTCPEPPPCPPIPTGSPNICPKVVDNNNPCNYVPPECPDSDSPDLTKLKKLQCLFQEDNDIPVYLKKGNMDAFLYQTTNVLVIISLCSAIYSTASLIMK